MILVTGGTGLTGSAVLREFARNGHPARALVRDPARATALRALPGIETVPADLLHPASLGPALAGVDTVVLISGADARMAQAQGNLIDAAVAAGVGHIVKVSGLGAAPDSRFRYGRLHAQAEDHLRAAGIGWTLLRPSQFMQTYYREVPTMLASGTFAVPLGDTRLAPIDVADIAKVAYLAATTAGHESATYELTGPEALTMTEVCAVLSTVVGKTIRYVDIAPADKHRALVDAGIPAHFADDLDDLFRLRRDGGPESQVRVAVFDRLNIRPTSFAEFVVRSAPVFRGVSTPDQLWASGWHPAEAGATA